MTLQKKLKMSDEVRELIRHLHPGIKQKVRLALSEIMDNPVIGKPLRGELEGIRSHRVSKFRIIYRMVSNVREIIALGPRHIIYEETLRLIRKEEW